jgi:hypothetical protein
MAIAAARGLLERMDMLMRLNVAIVADKYVEDGDILRLVDVRRIPDAMELIKVLYTQLHGIDMSAVNERGTTLPIAGVSYWVRQVLDAAAKAKKRDDDELSKHYRELLGILQLTKRTIREGRFYRYRYEKQMALMHRIRQLPDVYSSFYWLADSLSYRL